ncbi:MAG: ADP-ribosylglycohydrolase family protein [Clostridia bacterium]|nr:ADP-ribosylglycohydrolase family protein [Clostridia bacterium]
MKFINTEYLKSAMLGLIVADALGVPFEFKNRGTFRVAGMTGYGTHNQPVGTWSDDSSMTLATLDSMIRTEKLNCDDIMERFTGWFDDGTYCPYGECFDIGHTTLTAIGKYKSGYSATRCGGKGFKDNGNGSLMRILPIAFVEHTVDDILDLSSLTHAHEISLMSCRLYVQIAENLMSGMSKEDAITHLRCCVDECENIPKMKDYPQEQIKSSGYVIDSFEAAVWSFVNSESYRECVIKAVELGDDTDTVAAIAGGLAGIYYGIGGEKGIPEEWIDTLARKDWIMEMLDKACE